MAPSTFLTTSMRQLRNPRVCEAEGSVLAEWVASSLNVGGGGELSVGELDCVCHVQYY